MVAKKLAHHHYLWPLMCVWFVTCLLRAVADYIRARKYDGFCFMDIADYLSSILCPWVIVYTLRQDSKHWRYLY